jgi:hypothetical protein
LTAEEAVDLRPVGGPQADRRAGAFLAARYYDFNVWTKRKRVEKLRYMHRNPVKRAWWKSRRIGLGVVSVTI